MAKNTCPHCNNDVLPTDRFCPVCGAIIDSSENPESTDLCWFCKKYPAENTWNVPVELAANPKEYTVDKDGFETIAVPGTQRIGEKRILKYDIKTVNVPRCSHCGAFSAWNKKLAYIAAGLPIGLALVFEWIFSTVFQITNMFFISILPLYVLSFLGFNQLSRRKWHELGIPEKIKINPVLAKQHPQVLALIEQEWQIGLPKGYKPKAM